MPPKLWQVSTVDAFLTSYLPLKDLKDLAGCLLLYHEMFSWKVTYNVSVCN